MPSVSCHAIVGLCHMTACCAETQDMQKRWESDLVYIHESRLPIRGAEYYPSREQIQRKLGLGTGNSGGWSVKADDMLLQFLLRAQRYGSGAELWEMAWIGCYIMLPPRPLPSPLNHRHDGSSE